MPTQEVQQLTETPTEAPVSEPVEAPVSEPVEVASEPQPDGFDWGGWKRDFSALPEKVRPWVERAVQPWTQDTQKAQRDAQYYRALYDAMNSGDEDPRVQEYEARVQGYEARVQEYEARIAGLEQFVERENDRYMDWFEKEYSDQEAALEPLADDIISLHQQGFELHEAAEICLRGSEALQMARDLLQRGVQDPAIVMELLDVRLPKAAPAAPATPASPVAPVRPAPPSVLGASAPSRPAPLSKKAPTYHEDRDAALASVAERVLRGR